MTLQKISSKFILIFAFLLATTLAHSDNLRQISNHEGISNNAVLSLGQDQNGYIWVGTCDGLNMWDGTRMQLFPTDWGLSNDISGNLIERIVSTSDGYFWIDTNYGLSCVNPTTRATENHTEIQGFMKFTASSREKVLVLTADQSWHYYNRKEKKFLKSETPIDIPYGAYYQLILDTNDILTIFTYQNIYCFQVEFDSVGAPHFTPIEHGLQIDGIKHVASDQHGIYIIDQQHSFYTYHSTDRALTHIIDLHDSINDRGNISHIIRDGEDFLISFYTNGIVRLHYQPESRKEHYTIEPMDIQCGVFFMLKDRNQDIVWIATDGHGLFSYAKGSTNFRSITFQDLPYQLSKPVRDLFVDADNHLWIATKGEGIIRIDDFYSQHDFTPENVIHYTTENSSLQHNSVYTFANSSHNIIWIGHEATGLNYYSFDDNSIHAIPSNPNIYNVHDIYESDPNTLWITTGNGVYKLSLSFTDQTPHIVDSQHIDFGDQLKDKTLFFSIYPDNDSTIWFANRGGGAIEYDILTDNYQIHASDSEKLIYNDIFSIYRSQNGALWFASGGGVISQENTPIAGIQGAIHGILEDNNGNLWISTNRGLSKYNIASGNAVNYGYSYGLQIIEYSDGAYFADDRHNTLLFGGINGFVVISQSGNIEKRYNPDILFNDITINDQVLPIRSMLSEDGLLELQPSHRTFTINTTALDYIDGSNYTYFFRVIGYSDTWQKTANSVTFKDITPGTYTLEVKYCNNMTGEYSPVYTLQFEVLAHWWESTTAKIIYILLLIGIITLIAYLIIRRYRRRRAEKLKRLETQRREQQYESKINLFSNLTHELSIPLTMISAPCQRIINDSSSGSAPYEHARTIQQNVAKMQNLVYMLHQFRGENITGKECNIELVGISELANRIIETFSAFATQNNIRCNVNIPQNLIWPTDRDGLSTILNNLLSNAFKHTPYNGEVSVNITVEKDRLTLSVANDSKGVDMEDIDAIFDRYRVLDYFEKKSRKGLSITGDLALAICHSITERLSGEIAVDSIPNATTSFTIRLPRLKPSEQTSAEQNIISDVPEYGLPTRTEVKQYPFDPKKQTLVIINDNADISSLVAELFEAEFNIKIYNSYEGVAELMRQMHPDIIISDIISKDADNLDFIRDLKQSKLTSHIPVILLSTPPQIERHIKGLESGADICITLPFNTDYLKASVKQLLRRNSQLKDYYKSSISSFELTNGKMLHKDDVEFIEKMISIISNNLTNNDISTAFIAREMGVSVRNLYRRIEGSLDQTPSNIIKEYRLATAEHLLTTTKLSIDEIIYKAGFVNRGTFFRCFSAKYGVTPKAYRTQKLSGIDIKTE